MIIDYSWAKPSIDAMKAAGVIGVIRYLSYDGRKNLTVPEKTALDNAGIPIALVWESTEYRVLDGAAAGRADAEEAQRQAAILGFPAGTVIYFACDFDAGTTDAKNAFGPDGYYTAAAEVLGTITGQGCQRTGVYGGTNIIDAADLAGYCYLWQTDAWSPTGRRDCARLYQNSSVTVGGVSVDGNTAYRADWGQTPRPDAGGIQAPAWPGRDFAYTPGSAAMTGDDIRDWQQQMAHRGWTIGVDGVYGPQSEDVCRQFQQDSTDHGWPLDVDGVVGPKTWDATWRRPVS